jgi:NADH-quinone oxidoreductase subunit H
MITGCAFLAVLFLGGWHLPWLPWLQAESTGILAMLAKIVVLFAKVCLFMFLFMLVRWTLPRFRFDQLMRMAWKGLVPASLGVLLVAILGLHWGVHRNLLFTLTGNIVVVVAAVWLMSRMKRPVSGRETNLPSILRASSDAAGVQG